MAKANNLFQSAMKGQMWDLQDHQPAQPAGNSFSASIQDSEPILVSTFCSYFSLLVILKYAQPKNRGLLQGKQLHTAFESVGLGFSTETNPISVPNFA